MAAVSFPQPLGLLRPSSATRWVNCSGSHALEGLYPEDEDSPEAREGTAAHYYATEALEGRVHPVGALAPNGHPIDAYMVEGARHWIDDVAAELLTRLDTSALQHVVAAHLSEKCNRPELAVAALSGALGCAAEWIGVADQENGVGWRSFC